MNRLHLFLAVIAAALIVKASVLRADNAGPTGGTRIADLATGEQVYRNICQACHMADGKGATGAAKIPPLAANAALAASEYPIAIVTTGRGAMPALGNTLTPKQIGMVVTYVRTHFGNHYTQSVTTEAVKAMIDSVRQPSHPEELP